MHNVFIPYLDTKLFTARDILPCGGLPTGTEMVISLGGGAGGVN